MLAGRRAIILGCPGRTMPCRPGTFPRGRTMTARPFPLPSDLNGKRALVPLVRATIAAARATLFEPDRNAVRVAKQLWPRDEATLELVQRATSSAATTSD